MGDMERCVDWWLSRGESGYGIMELESVGYGIMDICGTTWCGLDLGDRRYEYRV